MFSFGKKDATISAQGYEPEKAQKIESAMSKLYDALGMRPSEGINEINVYNANVSTRDGQIRAAVNATKQLGIFNRFTGKNSVEKIPADMAHELAHIISPFGEYAQAFHKEPDQVPYSQAALETVALHCLLTNTYLNDYHALKSEQYSKEKISLHDFSDETFSILIETLFFAPEKFAPITKTLNERMSILNPQLSQVDPLNAVVTVLMRVRGMPDDLTGTLGKAYGSGKAAMRVMGELIDQLHVQTEEW